MATGDTTRQDFGGTGTDLRSSLLYKALALQVLELDEVNGGQRWAFRIRRFFFWGFVCFFWEGGKNAWV